MRAAKWWTRLTAVNRGRISSALYPGSELSVTIRREKPRAMVVGNTMSLARFFGTDAELWLGLRTAYDLPVARARSRKAIEWEIRPCAARRQ